MKKNRKDFNNQFATIALREEMEVEEQSVTGGGEAYLPGLDVPEKKYKGPKESEVHDGYKKVKGFRAGHTKDTGGFLYKDLWNINEAQFKEIVSTSEKDKVYKLLDLIKDKDQKLYNRFLGWIADIFPHSYDEFRMAAGGLAEDEEMDEPLLKVGDRVQVTYGNQFYGMTGTIEDVRRGFIVVSINDEDGEEIGEFSMHASDVEKVDDEEDLDEVEGNEKFKVGDEVKVTDHQSLHGGNVGKVVSVDADTNTYVLQFQNGQNASYQESDLEIRKKKGEPKGPQMVLSLDESYSKFRNETKTRTKSQQMHEAMKLAEKKIKEINKILEYTTQLKTELFEEETEDAYSHYTRRIMERMVNSVVRAYTKIKKLK